MVGNCLLDLFIYGSIPHDRLQSQAWDKWIHMHTYIYLGICMCACEWETERIDQELEKGRAISPLPALCVLSHIRLSVTPWTVARQTPSVHGILQARILEWVAILRCNTNLFLCPFLLFLKNLCIYLPYLFLVTLGLCCCLWALLLFVGFL